jgi:urease accessory protein
MDNFLPLLQAFDALFPVGAYTLSGGLETYVQKGVVHDRDTLESFLKAYLYALPYQDLGIAALAAGGGDMIRLDSLCGAMKAAAEIRGGSVKLCARFLKAQAALGDYGQLPAYSQLIAARRCRGYYPVAAGLFIRAWGADTGAALRLYAYSLLAAIVNHAVKLVPLRQLEGQSALFAALEKIPAAVSQALAVDEDELGLGGVGFTLRAAQHESLYSRLYIS